MNLHQFNFEHVQFLWSLILIPVVFVLYGLKHRIKALNSKLEKFADAHLLAFLVKNNGLKGSKTKRNLWTWSLIWVLGALALSGPRWNYTEQSIYRSNKDLVILLDLSKSMDATDEKPSRLVRARQKIQDILDQSNGVNIGLVAFAADAHLVTPITEDKETIHHLLSSLSTDLIAVQGSVLSPALNLSDSLLKVLPGTEKAVLVMSDGEFDDPNLAEALNTLVSQGVIVNTMAFGTKSGAPVPSEFNVISKEKPHALESISTDGHGAFLNSNSLVSVNRLFGNRLSKVAESSKISGQTIRDWEPRFYIFLVPLMLLMLPLFRRKIAFDKKSVAKSLSATALLVLFILPNNSRADETDKFEAKSPSNRVVKDLFKK